MNEAVLILNEIALANLAWLTIARFINRRVPFSFINRRVPFSPLAYCLIFLAWALGHLVIDTLERDHAGMLLDLAFAAIFIWFIRLLWRKRRKRRGRLAALGSKARARIAEMKRKMAERPARPVLRPVPQGGAA